jgi:drug/metabolite transporter (DMT)-like permease
VNNWTLYSLTVVIWGSTWIGIKYQLGVIDPMASIAHRFMLAALLLGIFMLVRRQPMRLPLRDHPFLLLQGLCLFCTNFYFIYHAEMVLASGLVAVVFSTLMMFNVINGALFMGSKIHVGVVIGGLIGLAGMAAVFWPELDTLDLSDENFVALLYCLAGTASASFGNIIAARNRKYERPVLVTNIWAMGYGAAAMYVAAMLTGVPIAIDWQAPYIISLLYLSVFGSVIAFWAYLTLIGRIGADRAGYANVIFPLVALLISTVVENYQWTPLALSGVAIVVFGNWLVMRAAKTQVPARHHASRH